MGTNEFDSDPTDKQTNSSDRDFDSRAEEQGELLAAVRASQRELAERIGALEESVTEYAQILASNREFRAERALERSRGVEASIGQYPDQVRQNQHESEQHRKPNVLPREAERNQPDRGRGFGL